MHRYDITTRSDQELVRRLDWLTAETRDARAEYSTQQLLTLMAERQAIVAEMDYRLVEQTWERWIARKAAEGVA